MSGVRKKIIGVIVYEYVIKIDRRNRSQWATVPPRRNCSHCIEQMDVLSRQGHVIKFRVTHIAQCPLQESYRVIKNITNTKYWRNRPGPLWVVLSTRQYSWVLSSITLLYLSPEQNVDTKLYSGIAKDVTTLFYSSTHFVSTLANTANG